jgi:hypothetical protein
MASAKSIVQQLVSFGRFIESQQQLLSPEAVAETKASMLNSLSSQITTLTITVDVAAELNQAISQSSFTEAEKGKLAAAVAKRFTMDCSVPHVGSKKTQHMAKPFNFLTNADWVKLKDPRVSMLTKLTTVADRLTNAGLIHPSEATTKAVVATVCCVHCPDADGKLLYSTVTEFKSVLAATRKDAHTITVTNFPDNPRDLPSDVFSRAYPDDSDPPITEMLHGYASILGRVPLRFTNKAVCGSRLVLPHGSHVGLQLASQPQPPVPSMPSATDMIGFLLKQLTMPKAMQDPCITYFKGSSSSSSGDAPCPLASPSTESPVRPLPTTCSPPPKAECDRTEPNDGGKPLCGGDVAARDDLDALSRMELAAAKGGNPKGEKVVKSSRGGMKRPAAAAAVLPAKRPAAAPMSFALGCGKCRGSPSGCTQCRNPSFTGNRFQKKK